MTITSEMLAAYAEGKVSGAERDAIRKYLAENPSELKSVVMMMDEDYDLDVDEDRGKLLDDISEDSFDSPIGTVGGMLGSIAAPSLFMSAAAFVPKMMSFHSFIETPKHNDKKSFSDRLDIFMDELGL